MARNGGEERRRASRLDPSRERGNLPDGDRKGGGSNAVVDQSQVVHRRPQRQRRRNGPCSSVAAQASGGCYEHALRARLGHMAGRGTHGEVLSEDGRDRRRRVEMGSVGQEDNGAVSSLRGFVEPLLAQLDLRDGPDGTRKQQDGVVTAPHAEEGKRGLRSNGPTIPQQCGGKPRRPRCTRVTPATRRAAVSDLDLSGSAAA